MTTWWDELADAQPRPRRHPGRHRAPLFLRWLRRGGRS